MSAVESKNIYALLGNDDEDSDTPKAPVKTVDKTSTHTTKRNAGDERPRGNAAPAGGPRRGPGGNEGAFRDRNAGSDRNRSKPTDDGSVRGGRGGRGRGGRGARFPRERDDRHTKGLPTGGSEKQAAQSWGATEGEAELKDEQAGEAEAQKELDADAAADENEPPVEEDKSVSYADYLAQLAEKKLALEGDLKVRKPNEGAKLKKEWAAAKPLVKDGGEDFIAGSGGKAKRERERKYKQVVDIDQRFVEQQDRPRGGGGRGGPRGGARGDFRGRGRGEGRGRGGGDFRGGRGGGPRGGGPGQPINTSDTSAFPSLGS